MSHHYSGVDFGFPLGDARLDFCDLYAFPKPGDPSRSILIMDVHPSKALDPPGSTTPEPFAPEAIYELRIDTDEDVVADIGYRFRFSRSENGAQSATVRRVEGVEAAGAGDGGVAIIEDAPVSSGTDAQMTQAGQYRWGRAAPWPSRVRWKARPSAATRSPPAGASGYRLRPPALPEVKARYGHCPKAAWQCRFAGGCWRRSRAGNVVDCWPARARPPG